MNRVAHSAFSSSAAAAGRLVLALACAAAGPTALFPAPARAAERLVWLAPERVPAARPFRAGLVVVADDAGARAPAGAAPAAMGGTLQEARQQGVVRTFLVRPTGSQVRLQARDGPLSAQAEVLVGPPAARVELTATPDAPVKGKDASASLQVVLRRGDGTPDADAPPPVLRANVGTLEELEPLGGGRFSAVYRLPRERYPEVAIVVAFAPWPHADAAEGAFGALPIPLSSSVSLPGKSEPRAQISVEIAGQRFGPVLADEKGAFEIPVIVPPGHRWAKSLTTDRLGNKRKKKLDLHLPATDQLACVSNPASLPAGAHAKVICVATDPYGEPVSGARLAARARLGRLDGPRPRGGAYEWDYTAPTALTAEGDELTFEYAAGGPQSRERVAVGFRPLAVASARVEVAPQPVFLGGGSAVATLLTADSGGRPVSARAQLAAARGSLGAFEPKGPGRASARYLPPAEPGDLKDRISGTVSSVPGAVPARLELTREGPRLAVRAEDHAGEPVEGLALQMGEAARATTGLDGIAYFDPPALGGALSAGSVTGVDRPSLRADFWRLRTAQGEQLFPDDGPFQPLVVAAVVDLAPPSPVDVQLEITRQGLKARVTDVEGRPVSGHKLVFNAWRGDGRPIGLGSPKEERDGTFQVPFLETVAGAVSASATDVASGVGAAEKAELP